MIHTRFAGNGTLVFTGNLAANGVAPPVGSCLNITGFSNAACNETAILPVPKYPEFPPKRPRCKNGTFILKGAPPHPLTRPLPAPSSNPHLLRPVCSPWIL